MCNHKFSEVIDGTTIQGKHLHVYQCIKEGCGLIDYSVEV